MHAFLVFLIIPISMALYFVLATNFGVFQNHPLPHYLAILVAIVWLAMMLRKQANLLRWVLLIGGIATGAGFVWWIEGFSRYAPRTAPVEIGQDLGGTLANANVLFEGEVKPIRDLLQGKRGTLLVFYRGHW